jgi:LemA protein
MNIVAWIVLIVIVLLVLGVVGAYNGFATLANRIKEAWSDIDVQLKRRHDLIPNLVNTVKGITKQEQQVFTQVTEARAKAISGHTLAEKAQGENMLSGALKTLFAVSENYPDIKSNANFLELQRELADTENKIMSARRFYNTLVRDFNIKRDTFPGNVIAGWFHFGSKELFELEDASERENVEVQF